MADKKSRGNNERFVVVSEAEFRKQVKKPKRSTGINKGKK